ncbi:RNA-directed DNA polymerase, eukaryota [Tanacetum coccineum]
MGLFDFVIDNWNGEVVIMGDFNEVCTQAERYGSIFNVQCANAFNSFISSTGLEEVPSGGCSFTWCHKSANKMSKLDRFSISEGLMISCPNITATTLYRYLSDHRPILLREYHVDYGPIPFREGDSDILNKRVYVSKSLQDIEKMESMEVRLFNSLIFFYADGVVFMGQWSDSNIETIVHVLECFHRASGLRINMNKSKFMRISVAKSIVEQAATKISCAILTVPFSYLGSKVGDLISRSRAWNDIVNKLTARLSKWKMKMLSIGGD